MLDKVITQDIFRAKKIFSQVSTPCLSEMLISQIVLQSPRPILMKRKKELKVIQ